MELAIFKNKLKKLKKTYGHGVEIITEMEAIFAFFTFSTLFINFYDFSSSVLKKK